MRASLVTLLVLVVALASVQSLAISNGGAFSPSQYAKTQVTYTITIKGADKTTLSIDGGTGVGFSKTKTVTLDGSKPHQFQVLQVICQSGWECGDQVTDWRKGMRLSTNQWTWTVPAGTTETQTYTETIPEYESVCVATDPHTGSCVSYQDEIIGYYTQPYTQETFTSPCKPCQFTFSYNSQYRLVIEDKHSAAGTYVYGWYDSCASVQLPGLGHPDTIAGSPGIRDAFNGWAIDDSSTTSTQVTMCSAHKATSTYNTQYLLDLNSQCPILQPTGGGWYNVGDTATIKVEQQAPMEGLLGQLGGKGVFNGWLGSPPIDSPSAQVVMHQPQTYTATCRADYTIPVVILIPAITAITAGGWYWNKKRKEEECDECGGFKLTYDPSPYDPSRPTLFTVPYGVVKVRPDQSMFSIPLRLDWPGSENRPVTFDYVAYNDPLDAHFPQRTQLVSGRSKAVLEGWVRKMTVGGGYVSSSGSLHKFLVKATGTAKSGKICTSETLVGVHICEDDVCSHEPFFLDQDAEGDVGITDENGNVKPVDVPIEPGDHISTGDNGSLRTGLNLNWTLDQLAKNQGVASPTGTGSTGTGMFVGSNTNVDWLDPLSRIPVPWLRWPTAEQIAKMTGLVVLHAAGKSFMNWQEHGVSRTQTILFARSPAEDDYSWAARVQGTRLFIESTKDGSTAAITVMEDFGRERAVEVWNLKNPNERLTVHGGEQLVVRAGKANPPVKVSINPKIEVDPFGILQKWDRLAPASPESLAALTTPPMKEFVGNGCPVCGRVNEPSRKFCVYCGTNMERPKKQPPEKHEPPGPELSGPCPNCGREISTKLKFCTYCGANLDPSVAKETTQKKAKRATARAETCRNCGREIATGLKFCIYCGTRR